MTASEIRRELAPNPASYNRARRAILAASEALRPVRVAVLPTCTLHTFEPVLFVEAALRGLKLDAWFAPFGQLEVPVLESGGALYAHEPEVLFVFARIEDIEPEVLRRLLTLDEAAREAVIERVVGRIATVLSAFRERSGATVLVSNFAPLTLQAAGLADAALAASQVAFVRAANARLSETCRATPGVFVFDFERLVMEHGMRSLDDPRMRHVARMPFSFAGQVAFARRFARTLAAAMRPPAKVLVLDLDNTLWGGVVGEDGPGGIALGDDAPGSIYKEFQHYLLGLRDRGVLLAIASKNNGADVDEVFAANREMVVKRADFSAARINWERKSANIAAMAAELNLGLDAFVFFDDNPAEREEVRAALPAVRVIEVPADPLGYIEAVEESGHFDALAISAEDRARARSYVARAAAEELRVSSPEGFLRSLETVVTVGHADALTLPRIVQLLGKTNQFNLTTRRHGEADVLRLRDAGAVVLWARAADKFGDHGLIAVGIAVPEAAGRWRVDSLLMSCRVIGRGVEHALLARLAAEVAARGGRELLGEYLPTPKNAQVATFYPDNGFLPHGDGVWLRDIGAMPVQPPDFIRIELHA